MKARPPTMASSSLLFPSGRDKLLHTLIAISIISYLFFSSALCLSTEGGHKQKISLVTFGFQAPKSAYSTLPSHSLHFQKFQNKKLEKISTTSPNKIYCYKYENIYYHFNSSLTLNKLIPIVVTGPFPDSHIHLSIQNLFPFINANDSLSLGSTPLWNAFIKVQGIQIQINRLSSYSIGQGLERKMLALEMNRDGFLNYFAQLPQSEKINYVNFLHLPYKFSNIYYIQTYLNLYRLNANYQTVWTCSYFLRSSSPVELYHSSIDPKSGNAILHFHIYPFKSTGFDNKLVVETKLNTLHGRNNDKSYIEITVISTVRNMIIVELDSESGKPYFIQTITMRPGIFYFPLHYLIFHPVKYQIIFPCYISNLDAQQEFLTLRDQFANPLDVLSVTSKFSLLIFDRYIENSTYEFTYFKEIDLQLPVLASFVERDNFPLVSMDNEGSFYFVFDCYIYTIDDSVQSVMYKIDQNYQIVWNITFPPRFFKGPNDFKPSNYVKEDGSYVYFCSCTFQEDLRESSCYLGKYCARTGKEIWKQMLIDEIKIGVSNYPDLAIIQAEHTDQSLMLVVQNLLSAVIKFNNIPLQSSGNEKAYILVFHENCTCNDERDCLTPYCYGIDALSEEVCSGNGFCNDVNKCSCVNNSYSGNMCGHKLCNGIKDNEQFVCNGRGICVAPNQCQCLTGTGKFCEDFVCNGIPSKSPDVCSGHGECIGVDLCRCSLNYTGSNCEIKVEHIPFHCPQGSFLRPFQQSIVRESKIIEFGFKTTGPAFFELRWNGTEKKENETLSLVDYLYVSGTHDMYQYDFKSNSWTSIIEIPRTAVKTFFTINKNPTRDADQEIMYVAYGAQSTIFVRKINALTFVELDSISSVAVPTDASLILQYMALSDCGSRLRIVGVFTSQKSQTFRLFDKCTALVHSANQDTDFVIEIDSNDLSCIYIQPLVHSYYPARISSSLFESYIVTFFQSQPGSFIKVENQGSIAWTRIVELPIEVLGSDNFGDIVYISSLPTASPLQHYFVRADSQGYVKHKVLIQDIENFSTMENMVIDDYNDIYLQGTYYFVGKYDRPVSFLHKYSPYGKNYWRTELYNCTLDHIKPGPNGILIVATILDGVSSVKIGSNVIKVDDDNSGSKVLVALLQGESCIPCPPGFIQPYNISYYTSNCEKCPPGTRSINRTLCEPCLPGTYSDQDPSKCTPCPLGYYSKTFGSNQCYQCFLGITFQSGADFTACILASLVICTLIIITMIILVGIIGICTISIKYVKAKQNERDELEKAIMRRDPLKSPLSSKNLRLLLDIHIAEISFNDLKRLRQIAEGGGSDTFILLADWNRMSVIIKLFRLSQTLTKNLGAENALKNSNYGSMSSDNDLFVLFKRELQLLATCHHKNIVHFYGFCWNPPKFGIVMEYCERGNLKQFSTSDRLLREDWKLKISILLDIAMAMDYLHSKNIIHRDLKTENVLIDQKMCAKVSDFGVSKFLSEYNSSSGDPSSQTKVVGTSYFMAPEITRGQIYDSKCDVFSFAIIMFEVLSCRHEHPYFHTLKSGGMEIGNVDLRVATDPNFRPQLPHDFEMPTLPKIANHISDSLFGEETQYSPQISDDSGQSNLLLGDVNLNRRTSQNLFNDYMGLMKSCWNDDPKKRPTFEAIVLHLQQTKTTYFS